MSQAVEAYRGITATEEFKYLEIMRARAGHDEAQAIRNAERRVLETERQKWQSVAEENKQLHRVAAENEQLRRQIATYKTNREA